MKKQILVDVRVVADVSRGMSWMWRSKLEEQAKQMQSLVSEFNDFVRDHRSMDWVDLSVERISIYMQSLPKRMGCRRGRIPMCCEEAQKEHKEALINGQK